MTRDYSQYFPSDMKPLNSERPLPPLQALGWQAHFAQQTSIDEMAEMPPVRVVEVHRNALHVVGDQIDETIPSLPEVAVGDWLLLDRNAPGSSRMLDRKSLIKRRAPGTDRQVQPIASNIDTAFIVTSCNQDFNVARLERYVVLAFDAEITPVIVITKADQVSEPDSYIRQAHEISELISVVALDARGGAPKTKLAEWCRPGQTVAFLGSSGVGKSTLTNSLSGTGSIETQAIREDDAKGRHTTTRRQLHLVPGFGMVLDTPGMRELQLTDAAAGIRDVYSDLHSLSTQCRFNDCNHETEPGCAVQSALAKGDIDAARLGRWRKLMAEEAFNSASLAERRSKDKAFGKMVRQVMYQKKRGRSFDQQ